MGKLPLPLPQTRSLLSPIIVAVENGDGDDLRKLLGQKSDTYDRSKLPVYPDDWKYKYCDLLEPDGEGRTPLQVACSVGNHEMALECVQLLCESVQVIFPESELDERDKLTEYINYTLPGSGPGPGLGTQSPLHFAIENKATKVIAYLLDKNANVHIESVKGTNALLLICQQVPDALTAVYDNTIQLSKDRKRIEIDLAKLIGFRKQFQPNKQEPADQSQSPAYKDKEYETETKTYHEVPVDEDEDPDPDKLGKSCDHDSHRNSSSSCSPVSAVDKNVVLWKETEYIRYIIDGDNWGSHLLLHPLVTLFLQKKWEKVGWFFWIPFAIQILWLFLYSMGFVQLQLYVDTVSGDGDGDGNDPNGAVLQSPLPLWAVLFFIALLKASKELYVRCVLENAYYSVERAVQISFILLHFLQFTLLMLGYLERAATISILGIALSTILTIFQLGKIPYFGQQVAAMKKVLYSFAPHMPLFFVWFLGFCLIFWALFYKSSESSVIVLLAIVAAMGTGEINAKDHLEDSLKRPVELHDLISVFCLMLFIITIATLYFNLLVGYAVSDIQALKQEAETFAISSRLAIIYTTESFLLSKMGRCFVRLFEFLRGHRESDYMDSIYVIPPSTFLKCPILTISVDSDGVPPEILQKFVEIGYRNSLKKKKIMARLERQIEKLYKTRC